MKRNMNDFWNSPKTRKDKAEYHRMQREWAKIQQQEYNTSQKSNGFKKSSNFKLVVCLCSIFVLVSWVFNVREDIKLNRPAANEIAISESGVHYNMGKKVSYKTNVYLEQSKKCTLKWSILAQAIIDNPQDFNAYSDNLNLLLSEIELLNEESISRFDELKSYEDVCEAYFGCMYTYFSLVKELQFISIDAYNRFLVELNSLETPYNHIIELFDEHGYYYYIDSGKQVHYKVRQSLF